VPDVHPLRHLSFCTGCKRVYYLNERTSRKEMPIPGATVVQNFTSGESTGTWTPAAHLALNRVIDHINHNRPDEAIMAVGEVEGAVGKLGRDIARWQALQQEKKMSSMPQISAEELVMVEYEALQQNVVQAYALVSETKAHLREASSPTLLWLANEEFQQEKKALENAKEKIERAIRAMDFITFASERIAAVKAAKEKRHVEG